MREKIDEENQKKSDALKALSKAQAEMQLWRSKYETEGLGHVEELESNRSKLSARLNEAEETIDTLNQKVASTEKTKHRLETELEDLQLEYERVHAAAIITERRGKNFDKVVLLVMIRISIKLYKTRMVFHLNFVLLLRSLENGKQRLMILALKSMQAKRNAEITTVSSSVLKLPGKKPWNNLTWLRGRTRISPMKSRTFLINWEMEADPFMSLTNNAVVLR